MSMDIIDDLLFEAGFDDALISHSLAGLIQIEVRRSTETEYMLTESIICSSVITKGLCRSNYRATLS